MRRRSWYMLAYDISDDRRLRQVHYFMRKRGLAMQKSVFFIHVNASELGQMLQRLRDMINSGQDDIRVYPIRHPAQIWLSGQQLLHGGNLLKPSADVAADADAEAPAEAPGWLSGLRNAWKKIISLPGGENKGTDTGGD